MEFDEKEAILYIRNKVGSSIAEKYSDDELLNLIDLIYDYLEANGFLEIEIDDDDDDEIDLEDLMVYVERMLRKDKGAELSISDARPMVEAYFEYENSLDE